MGRCPGCASLSHHAKWKVTKEGNRKRGREGSRAGEGEPLQTRSYMQIYAFALSTSSSVVSFTFWSLMYAHRRASDCLLSEDWLDWLVRESADAGVEAAYVRAREEGEGAPGRR